MEEPRQSPQCETRDGAQRGPRSTAARSAVCGWAAAALNNGNQQESSLYSPLNLDAVLWETKSMSHGGQACCPLRLVTDTGMKWPRGQ